MTAAHEWAKRLCALHWGDALFVGDLYHEHRICHMETKAGKPAYVVWHYGVPLVNVTVEGGVTRQRAIAQVADWLVGEGFAARDAVRRNDDPVALTFAPLPRPAIHEPVRSVPVIQFAVVGEQLSLFAA